MQNIKSESLYFLFIYKILGCIFSIQTADDDAEYGYHSASSSSELERQQQRRVNQQRGAGNFLWILCKVQYHSIRFYSWSIYKNILLLIKTYHLIIFYVSR